MILTPYTILLLAIAISTAVFALPLGWGSLRYYGKAKRAASMEEWDKIENGSYLLVLGAITVLVVNIAAWPLFYGTLQSCIAYVHGAMCIFGVTQIKPVLSNVVQLVKPAVFFFTGAWLVLHHVSMKTGSRALFKKKFLFLSGVSLLLFAGSLLDIVYFTTFAADTDVACCSTVFDLPDRGPAGLPVQLAGTWPEQTLLYLYYSVNVSLIAILGMSSRRVAPPTVFFSVGLYVLIVLCACITLIAWFEVVAPRVMQLPYHHCIYCMWQHAPSQALMTGLFIVGIFSPGWAEVLRLSGRGEQADDAWTQYPRRLYRLGVFGLSSSLLLATIGMAAA